MPHRNDAAGFEPLVSRNKHYAAVTRALSLFVGRGRRFSNIDCERGAGVPARMMECYRQQPDTQDWRPIPPEQFASLVCFLGSGFNSTYLAAINSGQAAYDVPDGDGDAAALNTDSAEFNFEYAKATDPHGPGGADILPMERKALATIATRMGPRARAVAA